MTLVLAIGDIYHDSCAALVDEDGRVLFAASEERFSRVKKDRSFPRRALAHILDNYDIRESVLALCGGSPLGYIRGQLRSQFRHLAREGMWAKVPRNDTNPAPFGLLYIMDTPKYIKRKAYFERTARAMLRSRGLRIKETWRCDHHLAHAYGAWLSSGLSSPYVYTYDNYGDNSYSTLWNAHNGGLEQIKEWDYPGVNIAAVYMAVTAALGLIPGRHEGKVTGLAAHGEPHPAIKLKMLALINHSDWKFSYHYMVKKIKQHLTGRYLPQDIAATFQALTERHVRRALEEHVDVKGCDICLSGGLFANVSLNRAVKDMGFRRVYVHPGMSDEGLAVGTAVAYLAERRGVLAPRLDHVYLGPRYDDEEIKRALTKVGLSFRRYGDQGEIASLLANGKVVARFDGRMEYGPRALGNRSVLYRATERDVNDWLNRRLERTEFMPFAPTVLKGEADRAFFGMKGCEFTAKFMTITFRAKEGFKEKYKGVVHLDDTARPQILNRGDNPGYHTILEEYEKDTGEYAVLNTSFNMHEEPIVLTPRDAVRAFRASKLDYLAIGPYLAE